MFFWVEESRDSFESTEKTEAVSTADQDGIRVGDVSAARVLATGLGCTEGPVLRPNGEIVVTSMDQGRLYRLHDATVDVYAITGGGPNGATEGSDGAIYVAQNGDKWTRGKRRSEITGGIQKVASDGTVSWLTTDPIAPSDLCFGPDGLLYVTDPTRFRPTRDDGRLWLCDPKSGEAAIICSLDWYPNGIGFGLDDALYVARSAEAQIMRFPFAAGRLGKGETFCRMPFGRPDGFTFDVEGNLIVTATSQTEEPGQIQIFDRSGTLLHAFPPGPNTNYTNVALGDDRALIITDADPKRGGVISIDNWPFAGLPLYPFRSQMARDPH